MNVIIGNLALSHRATILKGNDSIGCETDSRLLSNFRIETLISLNSGDSGVQTIFGDKDTSNSIFWVNSFTSVRVRMSDGSAINGTLSKVYEGFHLWAVEYINNTLRIYIDGFLELEDSALIGKTFQLSSFMGSHTGGSSYGFSGEMKSFKVEDGFGLVLSDYDISGGFGGSFVSDLVGTFDATMNSQWWKQGIDAQYDTPALYKTTLVSPLTEDQNVIYTDATPYYPANDPYWNPYNQDATYDFAVSRDSDTIGTIGIAGLNKLDINISISF